MNKKILLTFLIFNLSFIIGVAQTNLVVNPSFEDTIMCPNSTNQLSKSVGWSSYGATPDYYNACSPVGNMSVPDNIYGYQIAASGNSYCGIVPWGKDDTSYVDIREFMGIQLASTIVVSTKYYVSLKVNFTINNFETGYASNKLGARFSTVPYSYSNPTPVNNVAHIYSDSIITDTIGWTRITGSFIADSAYKYISIGNFFDRANTDSIVFNSSLYASYYYIDDVCVSTDSAFAFNYTYTGIEEGQQKNILIYPNPVNDSFIIDVADNFNYYYKLIDMAGKEMLNTRNRGKTKVDVSSLSKGIYILNIKTENNSFNYKIIINH